MSSSQLGILTLILGPILSVIVTLIAVRFTRKTDKEEIKVSEKDSTTAQFVALTEGYQATFEQLKEGIAEAKAESAAAKTEAASNKEETARLTLRVTDLEKVNSEQKATIDENTKERDEILKYLEEVVNMVPVPPGPPPRPSRWLASRF